jgi:glucose uptake protein
MYLPVSFSQALALTVLSAVFWGSWGNSYKGTRGYPFALFYWDYIVGVVLCTFLFALTFGSMGITGEAFLANVRTADGVDCLYALVAGAIFNLANFLLVTAIDIAGLAIAFPIAIGIALVEGVVLSYALQPKGEALLLAAGVACALIAVLSDAKAYRSLSRQGLASLNARARPRTGIIVSVISGVLMGAFAPFVTRAMTRGHPLTPYSVAALFSIGALLCCFVFNVYLMKHPITGDVVKWREYWRAKPRNHLLGLLGGVAWGVGGCLNFIAASFVGVPISYAIGQSAPLIAALWGVLIWREFKGAPKTAWIAMSGMFVFYVAAIVLVALAYNG